MKSLPPVPVTSTRGVVLALSMPSCTRCCGRGVYLARSELRVCNCAYRGVFDRVMSAFHARTWSAQIYQRQSIKQSEWFADVHIIAMRALDGSDLRKAIYRLGCVEDRDWKIASVKVGLSRGNYFHELYRVKETVGRAWLETKPYGVFPIEDYFSMALPDAQSKRSLHRRLNSSFLPAQQRSSLAWAVAA